MSERTKPDVKKTGRSTIRHYVIGGPPGQAALEYAGATDLVDYYRGILNKIIGWSHLSLDEVEEAIRNAPDFVENNPHVKNFKHQYLEAVQRMRSE